jgi:hypothetical protein
LISSREVRVSVGLALADQVRNVSRSSLKPVNGSTAIRCALDLWMMSPIMMPLLLEILLLGMLSPLSKMLLGELLLQGSLFLQEP